MHLFSELLSDSCVELWTSLSIFELCTGTVVLGRSFTAFHSRDSPGRLAIAEGDLDVQRANIFRVLEPQEVALNFHRFLKISLLWMIMIYNDVFFIFLF